jgi:hypothetical protein
MSMSCASNRRGKKAPAKQLRTFSEISTLALVEEEAQPDPLSAANMVCHVHLNICDAYMNRRLLCNRMQQQMHVREHWSCIHTSGSALQRHAAARRLHAPLVLMLQ